jgi:hypothetical protein
MVHRRNVNRMVLWFVVFVLVAGLMPRSLSWAAFPSDDVKVLEPKDIAILADDKLVLAFIDVLAELEASRTFHTTSGFTPKEYKQYKDLVKFRLELLFEIHRRKIEIPPTVN